LSLYRWVCLWLCLRLKFITRSLELERWHGDKLTREGIISLVFALAAES